MLRIGAILVGLLLFGSPAGSDTSPKSRLDRSTYLTDFGLRKVMSLDPTGRIRWELKCPGGIPMGIAVTRSGVCYFGAKEAVHEVDRKGVIRRTIRIKGLATITSVQPLPKGHFLLTDYNPGRVVEIDGKGEIVWEATGSYYDAVRLPSGDTVAVGPNRKLDVLDSEGKVKQSTDMTGAGVSLQVLRNGNFLVSLFQRNEVVEIDPWGAVVWKMDKLKQPYRAQRLRNGNTLITEWQGRRVIEVDAKKNVVWEHKVRHSRGAVRVQ